jgi:hypothetical protein
LNEAAIRSEAKRSDLRNFPVFHDLIASKQSIDGQQSGNNHHAFTKVGNLRKNRKSRNDFDLPRIEFQFWADGVGGGLTKLC